MTVLAIALGLGCRPGEGGGEEGSSTTGGGTVSSGPAIADGITTGSSTTDACVPECEPGFECVDGVCVEACAFDAGCCDATLFHAVGDIDGDGRSDIALSDGAELIVLVYRSR